MKPITQTTKNGIGFYLKDSDTVDYTYFDNNGNIIKNKNIKKKYFKTECFEPIILTFWLLIISLSLSTLLYVYKVFITTGIDSIKFINIFKWFLFSVSIFGPIFSLCTIILTILWQAGEKKRPQMLKGAENMLHNAFEESGRIPTLDEIKNFSHYSKYCYIAITTLFSLYAAFLNPIMLYNSFYISAFAYLGICLIAYCRKLTIIQQIYTAKPNDEILEMVINAATDVDKQNDGL